MAVVSRRDGSPKATRSVPVWLVTWGTCAAMVAAEKKEHAQAIVRDRAGLTYIHARQATETDITRWDEVYGQVWKKVDA